ncbi:MAG: hypothetical protein ABIS36_23125 [Chryseolinea sp.]
MSIVKKIIFPRAFAFAVDDLGWNEGRNMLYDSPPGPYRVGIKRNFTLEDYQFMIKVAETVGVRVQCLFILSEMDRENVLAQYPTTTHMKSKWDNSHRVCKEQIEIMKYVVDQSAYMEFGLHGTGHEFWADDGVQRRAEWYNMQDRYPWPEEELRKHIEAFTRIMNQYGLSKPNGHSFPETFVPCAYSYYWNPNGDYSLGKLMWEYGAKYANTDFSQIPELSPPQEVNGGGFDHGVHVINRMNFGNLWHELNTVPKVTIDLQGTDIVESHWANWLAQDAFLQSEATTRWIDYYNCIQRVDNRYIAKNTEQLHSQWLYRKHTIIKEVSPGKVEIDNSVMPSDAFHRDLLGNLVLKIERNDDELLGKATLNGLSIPAILNFERYTFLYLPPLKAQKYTLEFELGAIEMNDYVLNDGTYNVYSASRRNEEFDIELKVYGTQTVKVKCESCTQVDSRTRGLHIDGFNYDTGMRMALIRITASDFQGSRGTIRLKA